MPAHGLVYETPRHALMLYTIPDLFVGDSRDAALKRVGTDSVRIDATMDCCCLPSNGEASSVAE